MCARYGLGFGNGRGAVAGLERRTGDWVVTPGFGTSLRYFAGNFVYPALPVPSVFRRRQ